MSTAVSDISSRHSVELTEGMIEIVSGILYAAREDVQTKSDIKSATVVIDLSSKKDSFTPGSDDSMVYVRWNVGEDIDEKMFEALVRFVSGTMKAPKQRVVLVGHKDTIDVVAACVLREYLGCKPEIAISILRESRPKCLSKHDLLETISNYRIS